MTAPADPIYDADEPMTTLSAPGRVRPRSSGDAAGEWIEQNARALGGVAVVVAVLVAGGFAWRSSTRATAERADRALYEAEGRFVQGDPGAAQALQSIVGRYGDTPAGAHARVLLAQSYYDQGKYADGLRTLGSGSPPKEWRVATERLRAVGDEGAGRPKDAAAIYERLAKDAGPDERALLLADAARAYESAGARTDARRVWQQVLDLGTRGVAEEARVRLGELEARGG